MDDDLLTVTTLTNGNAEVLTTADYFLLPRNDTPYYMVVLKDTSDKIWEVNSTTSSRQGAITLAGTWGFWATAPADVRMACEMICESTYRNRFGENLGGTATITAAGVVITPQDVPAMATDIINRYKRIV